MRRAFISFPVESRKLAAMLAASSECWPGSYCGIVWAENGIVVSDEPEGQDVLPVDDAVFRIFNPVGRGWGRDDGWKGPHGEGNQGRSP